MYASLWGCPFIIIVLFIFDKPPPPLKAATVSTAASSIVAKLPSGVVTVPAPAKPGS